VSETSTYAVWGRFKETGCFDALKFDWEEGKPNKPHIFLDSDIAKWIESVAFVVAKKRNKELESAFAYYYATKKDKFLKLICEIHSLPCLCQQRSN